MKIMLEYWKPIRGYEGLYLISNKGRVYSLERYIIRSNGKPQIVKSRLLIPRYNSRTNMMEIKLSNSGKKECKKIHRLVAEAFVYNDNPLEKTTVNHIDGNRMNNCYLNLEWASYSENLKHAYDVLHRQKNRASQHRRPCVSIDCSGNVMKYNSIAEASRCTGISETQIRRIIDNECVNLMYNFEYV